MKKGLLNKLLFSLAVFMSIALLASCGNEGNGSETAPPVRDSSTQEAPTPGGLLLPEDDLSGIGEFGDDQSSGQADQTATEKAETPDQGNAEPADTRKGDDPAVTGDVTDTVTGKSPVDTADIKGGEDTFSSGADHGADTSKTGAEDTEDPFSEIIDIIGGGEDIDLPIDFFD